MIISPNQRKNSVKGTREGASLDNVGVIRQDTLVRHHATVSKQNDNKLLRSGTWSVKTLVKPES